MGKVVSQQDLILRCRQRKDNGEKIVLIAGVFDLLHPGHVRLLEQARDFGDVLVAAVLKDASARAVVAAEGLKNSRLAGVQRPVTPAAERAEILAALAAVDYVVEVDADAAPLLVAELAPDVAVRTAEPSYGALLAGAAKDSGVRLVHIPLEPGHSTAGIIERIVRLSGSE